VGCVVSSRFSPRTAVLDGERGAWLQAARRKMSKPKVKCLKLNFIYSDHFF
jgi:hypothetical protein